MSGAPLKLLITGDPGCGKTTLIRGLLQRLPDGFPVRGFWTEEIRDGGRRSGFRGCTVDGRSFPLADRGSKSELRVGPYGVELDGLEAIGLPSLIPEPGTRLIVLDEVGKMEVFSTVFRERVEALLAGDVPLVATVAAHGVGFVKRVRRDTRATLLRMRRETAASLASEILRRMERAGILAPG